MGAGHFPEIPGSTPNGRPELRTGERPRLQLCTALSISIIDSNKYELSKLELPPHTYQGSNRLVGPGVMEGDDILTQFSA